MNVFVKKWNDLSIIIRIIIGLTLGTLFAVYMGTTFAPISILGSIFVGALKAIAPLLVFFLVISAISQHKANTQTNMKSIIFLYLLGTFLSALIAVVLSFIFPLTLSLDLTESASISPPQNIFEVLKTIIMNMVDNPIKALYSANYIGILTWAILFGMSLKNSTDSTKKFLNDFSNSISTVVKWIINLAPFGIMGLVFDSITTSGIGALLNYSKLLLLLVGAMLVIALIVNPIITYIYIKKNPYPLVLKCLKHSGLTAFFTRSSAANIPVNMQLCQELGLNKDTYSVSIPLGATINMGGAAITITILTLAAVNTLGISVDIPSALILSLLAAISACGASGVAGGSLLLIPLACSLFGINNEQAMQIVSVGFIIGVIQDSCETAINSSTDVLFTAIAEFKKSN